MKTIKELMIEARGLPYPNQRRLDEIKAIIQDREDVLGLIDEYSYAAPHICKELKVRLKGKDINQNKCEGDKNG